MNTARASTGQNLNSHSTSSHIASTRHISLQERMFLMGNVAGINAYRLNRVVLKRRILEDGYQVYEVPHFLVGKKAGAAIPTVVVHWFPPQAIDNNLGHFLMEELKPLGVLDNPQAFGNVFGAVVCSLFPGDYNQAWYQFGINTLQKFRTLFASKNQVPQCDFPMDVFATLYKRVCDLVVGESLLDAGCSFGFLPLVIGERIPSLKRIVGIDIRDESFVVTRALASDIGLANVAFLQADLLAGDLDKLGRFETVVVLHVIEHFSEEEMYHVLASLLRVTTRRLLIAVPYEPEIEHTYGHRQMFTPVSLEALGSWCLERVGKGNIRLEECAGGLLIVDVPHGNA